MTIEYLYIHRCVSVWSSETIADSLSYSGTTTTQIAASLCVGTLQTVARGWSLAVDGAGYILVLSTHNEQHLRVRSERSVWPNIAQAKMFKSVRREQVEWKYCLSFRYLSSFDRFVHIFIRMMLRWPEAFEDSRLQAGFIFGSKNASDLSDRLDLVEPRCVCDQHLANCLIWKSFQPLILGQPMMRRPIKQATRTGFAFHQIYYNARPATK